MPEEHLHTGEVDEAEEVLDVLLPSRNEPAEVLHPGEQAFHSPASHRTLFIGAVRLLRRDAALNCFQQITVYATPDFWNKNCSDSTTPRRRSAQLMTAVMGKLPRSDSVLSHPPASANAELAHFLIGHGPPRSVRRSADWRQLKKHAAFYGGMSAWTSPVFSQLVFPCCRLGAGSWND